MEHDPFVSCPFNIAHRVPLSRLQGHIVKCEKLHPGYKACPYNATHRVLSQDIKEHINHCPSKERVFPEDKVTKVIASMTKPRPILQREYLPETDPHHEIWDD